MRNVKNINRGSRKIAEEKIPSATWQKIIAAAQAYDALPPGLRPFSIHHPHLRKLRGKGT
jgi:hypothetical protein